MVAGAPDEGDHRPVARSAATPRSSAATSIGLSVRTLSRRRSPADEGDLVIVGQRFVHVAYTPFSAARTYGRCGSSAGNRAGERGPRALEVGAPASSSSHRSTESSRREANVRSRDPHRSQTGTPVR